MTVLSGFRTAWRFAGSPTRMPSFVKATTDGNIFPPYALPSALGMIRGVPPSMYPASELVVPRSIPMILAIRFTSVLDDDDLSGTQDAVVEPIALPHDRFDGAVLHLGIRQLLDAIHLVRVEDPTLGGNLLEADLLEDLHQIVPDHPDAFPRLALDPRDRGVYLVEDRQEPGQKELVGELDDRLGVAVHALAVVLELRLEILQLREELFILASELGELIAGRGRFRFVEGRVLRLILVLQRARLLAHLRYLS